MSRRLLLLATLITLGCAHGGEPDIATLASNSDQLIWEAGQKEAARHNWESARKYFKRLIDGFPQSELGPTVRLALADSYVREGASANYVLAISEYRQFLTLYPSHPRSDYAQLQIGECYFRQRNGPDRDQTQTEKALDEFQRLLDLYPSSPYVENARQRIVGCRESLARSEFLVGYFYQRTRQAYRAAIGRYEHLLAAYPDYPHLDEVLFRLAECLCFTGRPAEARPHLGHLLESYPASSFADSARRMATDLAQSPTVCSGGAVPAPSPPPSGPPAPPSPSASP